MAEIHETDGPVPATWISDDLWCPSGEAEGTRWHDFIPKEFLLFRVVRGELVARMSIPNRAHVSDEHFGGGTPLLDRFVVDGGAFLRSVPGPVPGLSGAMSAPGEGTLGRRCAGMLWNAGRADLDVLIPGLASTGDRDVLRWIGYALGRIGPDAAEAIPDLMRVLAATGDPEVARAMAYALAGIGPDAAPVLVTMIPLVEACCGRRAERQLALFVANLAPAGLRMIDPLIAALRVAGSPSVTYRIAGILGDVGPAAVMPLCAALAAAVDDRQRLVLARPLGKVGQEAGVALDLLLDTLRQARDDDARAVIAEAVTEIGLRAPTSLPPLSSVFRATTCDRVLRWIAKAAATLGGGAVGFLVEEFEAAGQAGQIEVAKVLGEFGSAAESAVGALAAAAKGSTNRNLLDALAQALAKIGAPAGVLFTARIAALRHAPRGHWVKDGLAEMQAALDAGLLLPDEDVRDLVAVLLDAAKTPAGRPIARMLGSIGKAAAEPLLIALDRARDQGTRGVILYALGQVGEPAEAAIDDAVIALSAAGDDGLRLQRVDDLMRMGRPDERHIATLADVLVRSSFPPVWWRLGLVLADFGAPAIAYLVRILDGATDDAQCRALENALLQVAIADASSGGALLAALRVATRPRTIGAIQAALNRSIQR